MNDTQMKKQKKRKPKKVIDKKQLDKKIVINKKLIKIPTEKKLLVAATLVNYEHELNYIQLAQVAEIQWTKLRDLVEEFQLFYLNTYYRFVYNYKQENFVYHFPSLAQFSNVQVEAILVNIMNLPRTTKVKKNQIIRLYTLYSGETLKEIADKLNLSFEFVRKFKLEFEKVMISDNNKKKLFLGERVGLHQLTEQRGIVQTLVIAYTMMNQPDLAKKITEELELRELEGRIRPDSTLADLQTTKYCTDQILSILNNNNLNELTKVIEIKKYQDLIETIREKYIGLTGEGLVAVSEASLSI